MKRALVLVAVLGCGGEKAGPDQKPPEAATTGSASVVVEPMAASLAYAKAVEAAEPAAVAIHAEHAAALQADCKAGSEVACVLFVMAYGTAVAGAQEQRERWVPELEKGCQAGDAIQCAMAAEALDDPSGTSTAVPQAIAGLVKVCEGGLSFACGRAGAIRVASGVDTPALDEKTARAHIERACASNDLTGCAMLVNLAGAIPPPDQFAASEQYKTRVRACDVGDLGSCMDIVKLLTPAPPFGCSMCDPEAAENNEWKLSNGDYEERCRDCSIATCRREHCCADCADRGKWACCGDDSVPVDYPLQPPPGDPAQRRSAGEAARRGTSRGLALWKAGCERGLVRWCDLVKELERVLAALDGPGAAVQ